MSLTHNIKIYKQRRRFLRKEQTKAEAILWEKIRSSKMLGIKFKRQHSIGYYIADFYSHKAKLIIEIDGDSHYQSGAKEYDNLRTEYFKNFSIKVLRFTNEEILNDLENVLNKITQELPHLTSPCKGEE